MPKRKVTRENFPIIKFYLEKTTLAETATHFGLSYPTLRMIADHATYDDYLRFLAKTASERYAQRHGKTPLTNTVFSVSDDKPAKTISSPFATSTEREGFGGTSTYKTVNVRPQTVANDTGRSKRSWTRIPALSTTKLLEICDMVEHGGTHREAAASVGLKNTTQLFAALGKNKEHLEMYNNSYEKGWGIRNDARIKRLAESRKKAIAEGRFGKKNKDKAELYAKAAQKAAETAAANKGMTVEEYKNWQRENIAKARAKKNVNNVNTEPKDVAAPQENACAGRCDECPKSVCEKRIERSAAKEFVKEYNELLAKRIKWDIRASKMLVAALATGMFGMIITAVLAVWKAFNG